MEEKIKNPVYDFMLNFFVSTNILDDKLRLIHFNEETNYVYATNSHLLIKVPAKCLSKTYTAQEKFPNAERLFLKFNDIPESGYITTESLIDALVLFNWHRDRDSDICPECLGEGDVECLECGHTHTCDKCDGAGKVDKGVLPLSLLISDVYDSRIKIGQSEFKVDFIQIVTILSSMLGNEKIIVKQSKYMNDGTVLKVGDSEIIIMPMLPSLGSITKEIKLNP